MTFWNVIAPIIWAIILIIVTAIAETAIETQYIFVSPCPPRTITTGPKCLREFRSKHKFTFFGTLGTSKKEDVQRILIPGLVIGMDMYLILWLSYGIWSGTVLTILWYVLCVMAFAAVVLVMWHFVVRRWIKANREPRFRELFWFLILAVVVAFPIAPSFASWFVSPILAACKVISAGVLNILDPFAGEAMRPFFNTAIPVVIFTAYVGLLLFFYFYRRWNKKKKWYMMVGLVIVIVAALILSTVTVANGADWKALSKSSGNGGGTAQNIAGTPGPNQVDIDSAINDLTVEKVEPVELERLMLEKYKDISWEFDDSSLSPHDRGRVKSTGMSDAVTYGIVSDDEDGVRKEIDERILRNVVVTVGYVNAIKEKKIYNKRIGDLNPWMDRMIKEQETGGQSGIKGVNHWLTYHDGDRSTIYVTEEFRCYAATVCTFFERLIYQGKQSKNVIEHWPLNCAMLDNDRACIFADYPHNKEAHIFTYVGKNEAQSGNPKGLFTVGIDNLDMRIEFYGEDDPPEVVKTPPTSSGDTPTNPGETPTNPKGDGGDPTEAPTDSKYNKDPNKAQYDNAESNDDSGSYEDSNNGEGATTSAKDSQYNSGNSSSKENHSAQSEQQQRNSNTNNVPSTNGGSSTNVDSNAGSGTGNGGIDSQTGISDPARTHDGQSVDNNSGNDRLGSVPD